MEKGKDFSEEKPIKHEDIWRIRVHCSGDPER